MNSPETPTVPLPDFINKAIEDAKTHFGHDTLRAAMETTLLNGNAAENVMVAAIYASTGKTLDQIGEAYGMSRQAIAGRKDRGIKYIYNATSGDLKNEILFSAINPHKENNPVTRAKALLRQGIAPEEIARQSNWTTQRRQRFREETGVEIPYLLRVKELAKNLKAATEDAQIEKLMDQVDHSFMNSKYADNVVSVVSNLAREAGFYFRNDQTVCFVKSLETSHVQVRTVLRKIYRGTEKEKIVYYYVIANQYIERALATWDIDGELTEFKSPTVEQICGPAMTELPTTTDLLRNHSHYVSPAKLLKHMGIEVGPGNPWKSADFITLDCPVAVFRISTQNHSIIYKVDKNDVPALTKFFAKRARELRATGKSKA